MPRTSVLALGLVVAGCAAPAATLPDADFAASPEPTVSLAPLSTTPRPDLPVPLRPTGSSTVTAEAAMDHGAHVPLAISGDTTVDHDQMPPPEDAPPLSRALDAYLSVQEGLADDDLALVPPQAHAFIEAWARATANAPADDPHFWHMRADAVAAVRDHALALAEADGLDDARQAFGHLSAAYVALVEAHGAPADYDLSRFTCGMRSDLPGGGVWLQRGAEPRNPYFGARMLTCATSGAAVPSSMHPEMDNAVGHTGHDR